MLSDYCVDFSVNKVFSLQAHTPESVPQELEEKILDIGCDIITPPLRREEYIQETTWSSLGSPV